MEKPKEETNRQLRFEEERPDAAQRLAMVQARRSSVALLLDQLDDPRNIGLLFRLADAANVRCVYLYRCGWTDLSHRLVGKTSRSTHKFVPFERLETPAALAPLRAMYEWTGLEVTTQSEPYHRVGYRQPQLLVVGNEERGVSAELLAMVGRTVHIPMLGLKTSMNVASATAVVLFKMLEEMNELG